MFTHISDVLKNKTTIGNPRSGAWKGVRAKHLLTQPRCVVCKGTKTLNVHHIMPFHLHPELELEPSNLVTLCESERHGVNCHLLFGHLGNFRNINPDVMVDTATWCTKMALTGD